MLPLAFTVASVVCLALVLVGEARDGRRLILTFKPLASAGFLGLALALGALEAGAYGGWILAGLVGCWFGDVFLMARGTGGLFLAGVGSFLLGHVFFVVAFAAVGVDVTWTLAGAAGVAVSSGLVARWLLPHVSGGMRVAVVAYVLVISAMVAGAAGVVGAGGKPLVLVAALLFYASDLSVARERFVTKAVFNRLWGLPAYYAGTLCFAWTLA